MYRICIGFYLVCVIWKVDLVEDLGGLVLDGLHLHQMRRVLPRSTPVAIAMDDKGIRDK